MPFIEESGGAGGGAGGDTTAFSKTANFAIDASGKYDNDGASGTITGTFAATPGILATIARVDDFELRILPSSGKQIIWSGGTMAVDEYLAITSTTGIITAHVNQAGNVVVNSETGAQQEQTPA